MAADNGLTTVSNTCFTTLPAAFFKMPATEAVVDSRSSQLVRIVQLTESVVDSLGMTVAVAAVGTRKM